MQVCEPFVDSLWCQDGSPWALSIPRPRGFLYKSSESIVARFAILERCFPLLISHIILSYLYVRKEMKEKKKNL